MALLLSVAMALTAITFAQSEDYATEVEPNDDWATASVLPTDQPLRGSLTPHDVDHFTFTISGATAEQLNDLVVDTDVTVTVGLYDSEARSLQERTGTGGALRSLSMTLSPCAVTLRTATSTSSPSACPRAVGFTASRCSG